MFEELREIAGDPSLLAPQRRKLTSRLGWICAVVAVAGHIAYMASSDRLALPTLIVPLFVLGFLSVPVILRRGGPFGVAVGLLLAVLVAALTGLAMMTGGLASPFLVLLAVTPIVAVILSGAGAAWLTALASLAAVVLLGALQGAGIQLADRAGWGISLARVVSVVGVGGLVLTLVGFYEQQLERLRSKLHSAATHDPLTGLVNRGSLDDALAIEHHRLARYPDSCLSVVLFNVDRFKEYNDANGRQAGDEALKRIAETALERVRRAPDVLGRYGGDEMLAVLPATGGSDAAILADCIRRDVEGLALPHSASPYGVLTVSLGVVAEDASNPGSIDSLLTDAEQALRQAKLDGRNGVVSGTRTVDAGA